MTEHPRNDVLADDKEGTSAVDAGKDTRQAGRVRTGEETTVDEAMGQGPLPEK